MAREAEDWAKHGQDADRACARLLALSSDLTLRCCQPAFTTAFEMLDDLWRLLHRWRVAPEEILGPLARPEWLLDGWELICGLWRGTDPAQRGAALLEMAALVPVIPAEVRDWVGFDLVGEMHAHRSGMSRLVRLNHDWKTGRLMDLTARNEHLLALCA
ncbi:hypothetical protein [Siccirubricoccus sp. G192]|uniref:hypothetical protein n=1 Tax=Siccirubricoccus sp. G192 TaxID=2849651 RepID=UPI001C2CB788|nr:hypothetical protein [Siccirubricoccus sp. G192]MBV1795766.1 hypothetical protein [Siccirubricoccus sp. G192]